MKLRYRLTAAIAMCTVYSISTAHDDPIAHLGANLTRLPHTHTAADGLLLTGLIAAACCMLMFVLTRLRAAKSKSVRQQAAPTNVVRRDARLSSRQ